MNIVRTVLVIAALAVTAGCYRYVPADRAGVPPGAQVRARLTDAGVEEMSRFLGPSVVSVEGPLISWDGEGVALSSETSMQREGFAPTTWTETIQLAPHYVAGVEIQQLDGKRTAGLTAAILGGAVAAILATRAFGGGGDDPGGPGPDAAMILFGVPLRIGFR